MASETGFDLTTGKYPRLLLDLVSCETNLIITALTMRLWSVLGLAALVQGKKFFEIQDVFGAFHYDIEWVIGQEFVQPGDTSVSLTLKGNNYTCVLPMNVTAGERGKLDLSPDLLENAVAKIDATADNEKCLNRAGSYWFYRICENGNVTQFYPRVEKREMKNEQGADIEYYYASLPDESENTHRFHLGQLSPDQNEFYMMDNDLYLKRKFENGDYCGLTATTRTTYVYYYCDPGLAAKNAAPKLELFEESVTCEYRAFVAHPALCELEEFLPYQKPTNIIRCGPVVDLAQVTLAAGGQKETLE